MKPRSRIIPVRLSNGAVIQAVATVTDPEEDVSFDIFDFSEITEAIEGMSAELVQVIRRAMPQKAIVEFGFQVGIESGKLTALLVKGSAQANVKVVLEWSFGDAGGSTSANA